MTDGASWTPSDKARFAIEKAEMHYADLEKRFRELLKETMDQLSFNDLAEAFDFLSAGEYGLALDTFTACLDNPTELVSKMISDLAELMEWNTPATS